jgi:integrase/recombinase XerD
VKNEIVQADGRPLKTWPLGNPSKLSPEDKQILAETIREAFTVNYNKHTVRAYRDDMVAFFDVTNLGQITIEQVLTVTSKKAAEYRDALMAKGLANNTIRRRLTFVRKFYKYLHRKGCIPHNPIEFVQLPNPKEDEIIVTPLSDAHVQRLLAAPTQSWQGRRTYTLIVFGLAFGLRRSEIARIKTDQFLRNNNGLLSFKVTTKGAKQRTCVLSPIVEETLRRWIAIRGDFNGPLFPSARCHLKKQIHPDQIGGLIVSLAMRAGIQELISSGSERRKSKRWKVGAHSLRATFIYQQYKQGVPIDQIAAMVGHESTEVTWRYLKRIERDQQNLVSTSCDSFIKATLDREGDPVTDLPGDMIRQSEAESRF